jgi:hypothetical protein
MVVSYFEFSSANLPLEDTLGAKHASHNPNDSAKGTAKGPAPKLEAGDTKKNCCHANHAKHGGMEWWKTVIETLTLISVIYYASVARGQLGAMIESNRIGAVSSSLAYRPYIGVDGVRVSFLSRGANGAILSSPGPLKQTESLLFKPAIKNFGSIPGEKYAGSWRIFYGGAEVPGTKIADTPITLYPTQIMAFDGQFTGDRYRAVVSGAMPLVIEVTVDYDGPTDYDGKSKHYHECVKEQFDPAQSAFLNLGACTH